MTRLNYLTNDELVNQLLTRDDLTEIEHELLDRFIRALDEITELERERGGVNGFDA